MARIQKGESPQKDRILFEVPDFDIFGELLHDRLHAIFYHYEEWSSKFMLITNLFDRDPIRLKTRKKNRPDDLEALVYSGTNQARAILEKQPLRELDKIEQQEKKTSSLGTYAPPVNYIKKCEKEGIPFNKQQWQKERDQNWDFLRNKEMDRNTPKLETFPFFDEFRDNKLAFEKIEVKPLSKYFENINNNFQKNEYPIISDYFDIEKDKYIGIPLLGMGLFQGLVWIIFKGEESHQLEDPKTLRRIVKYFQVEYDNLTLDWDVADQNIKKESLMPHIIDLVNPTNQIQRAVKLKNYYNISNYYHANRIEQSDKVVKEIKAQFLKTAIITILLDSYAHNISAHSLTTLAWWLKERAEFLKKPKDNEDEIRQLQKKLRQLGRGNNPLIKHYDIGQQPNLSKELAPLFKFLLEKGAFWSGITRQTNFTGKISSLYNIFWYDFINNPLYLGTIANTEKVRILYINFTIYESEIPISDFENHKMIARSEKGIPLSGNFACIDLTNFNTKGDDSIFVKKGDEFNILAKPLKAAKAFFPGGVVGKHAFFTLLENEIRNVKHYDGDILKDIQNNGLHLNLSIHQRPVDSTTPSKTNDLLKIGVWLNHKVDLTKDLLIERIKDLHENVITTDQFQPRLGGKFQDKICASMLLTSTFEKVQDESTKLAGIYYPWIKTASALIQQKKQDVVQEFEISHRKFYPNKENLDDNRAADLISAEGMGYLKKYFHLWQGADIVEAKNYQLKESANLEKGVIDNSLENHARFRFVHLAFNSPYAYLNYKKAGIIRLLQHTKKPTDVDAAYQQWMPIWLKPKDGFIDVAIDFIEGDTSVARLLYVNKALQFENAEQIRNYTDNRKKQRQFKRIQHKKSIAFAHRALLTGDTNRFNYRSHGALVRKFGAGLHPKDIENMPDALAYELLETLMTNICIFDRRIYNRMVNPDADDVPLQIERQQHYKNELLLDVKGEDLDQWKAAKDRGFLNYHFLVVHLSFIEHLKDDDGNLYKEQTIIKFIKEQILKGKAASEVKDNFILVITTGRGRMAWWEEVKKDPEYARFTTFRPIESILGAVEDALEMPDDFNLKYNLTKLLFGS